MSRNEPLRLVPDLRLADQPPAELRPAARDPGLAAPRLPAVDSEFGRDLLLALSRRPRSIAPKYFYDAAGSALFDRICELPEYYPTRTETAILQTHAAAMADCLGGDAEIVEFGAGSSRKIRVLLDALARPRRFVPIDISAEHLHAAAAQLTAEHPGLEVLPLAADFTHLGALPAPHPAARRRIGFFPGSSIGNFTRSEALQFLRHTARLLGGGRLAPGGLLIGVDLVKDPALLHAAYNDAAGVTAAFNLNLLLRANRELGADFVPERFAHYAFYEPLQQRIEMHLVSRVAQCVHLCGQAFDLAEGDALHTENSHKYTVAGFQALAAQAGYRPGPVWCDPERLFSVHWLALPD
jgi:dimethylhistidine N-methyltransferase